MTTLIHMSLHVYTNLSVSYIPGSLTAKLKSMHRVVGKVCTLEVLIYMLPTLGEYNLRR